MKILFIHPSFPAQFQYFASLLSFTDGYEVSSISHKPPIGLGRVLEHHCPEGRPVPNINVYRREKNVQERSTNIEEHMRKLKIERYEPDVVIAHPRWGHSICVKDVWPSCKLALYLEYYFTGIHHPDEMTGDPQFRQQRADGFKNTILDLSMSAMDAALSPTRFQKGTFPERFRDRIDVIHDGINTKVFSPFVDINLKIGSRILSKKNKVLTFVSRSLEPIRGFPAFMRALPEILQSDPDVVVLIIGSFQTCYGQKPVGAETWQQKLTAELDEKVDFTRVEFLENVSKEITLKVLQLSTVHVHLSYPFTLSWSILEAMSVGCAIVASRGYPVEEVIDDGVEGLLVDINDIDELARAVISLFSKESERLRMGRSARRRIVNNFDVASVCFPKQIKWLNNLV
ncbi:MAG: glycosyltransferase [Gammaproteobacteria bacterium]|nr:MAG: glycosyltransferase [Gammaproteobacteria bacterium]